MITPRDGGNQGCQAEQQRRQTVEMHEFNLPRNKTHKNDLKFQWKSSWLARGLKILKN